jgi:hypothetical protein
VETQPRRASGRKRARTQLNSRQPAEREEEEEQQNCVPISDMAS